VVEDSERGLRSAIVASIDCVVVDSPFVRAQGFNGAGTRIDSINELPEFLLDSENFFPYPL
jgi:beta-phosphoglucomutase-like phosphatase (HAD superfamily)